jgi:PPK2 family polyphosphate:nucleotide phosphotransferase
VCADASEHVQISLSAGGIVAQQYLVKPRAKVRLSRVASDETAPFKDKADAADATAANLERLGELQQRLYGEAKRALLIILQGMDTSGKDGTIRHVFSGVNPQGCSVASFKAPTPIELAHDYLWRIHQATPPRGMITIFNRSHYESVLVERVQDIVPKKIWSRRYDQINQFERLLSDEGTTILKFFLHISKREQKRRLQDRLDDPSKHWKWDSHDLDVRKQWDQYAAAYEDALSRCSTDYAPWYMIPADHKWYRNWAISDVIVRTLEKIKPQFPKAKLPKDLKIE